MGTEIERKFLVRDVSVVNDADGIPYRQGYLSTVPERTVRSGSPGITPTSRSRGRIPARRGRSSSTRIPVVDARELLPMCVPPLIEKTRYRIEHDGLTWEVDVFEGENAGLVVAEVELPSADTPVDIPAWAGDEVTGDPRYYNANLVARPFTRWAEDSA